MNDPVGQLEVDFFTNASIEDGIVPNAASAALRHCFQYRERRVQQDWHRDDLQTFPDLLDELKVTEPSRRCLVAARISANRGSERR